VEGAECVRWQHEAAREAPWSGRGVEPSSMQTSGGRCRGLLLGPPGVIEDPGLDESGVRAGGENRGSLDDVTATGARPCQADDDVADVTVTGLGAGIIGH